MDRLPTNCSACRFIDAFRAKRLYVRENGEIVTLKLAANLPSLKPVDHSLIYI